MYLTYIFGGEFRILRQLNKVLVAVVVILLNNLKSFRKETFFQFFFATSPIEKVLKMHFNLATLSTCRSHSPFLSSSEKHCFIV